MSTSTLLDSLFKYKAWANEELFAELEKVDPVVHAAESHTATRILNHVYVVDRIFAAHLSGQEHHYTGTNTPETPTLAELSAGLAQSDLWYMQYVGSLPSEKLSEMVSFTFTDGAKGRMSREEILVHVALHGANHRGAVGRILAQISVPPPRDLFTIYLHKAEPERREPL